MRVIWEVDDGYAGKSRPQVTEIPDEELEDCDDEEERQALIEDSINDDFDTRISWYIKRYER